jgi:hypothetical protein
MKSATPKGNRLPDYNYELKITNYVVESKHRSAFMYFVLIFHFSLFTIHLYFRAQWKI